MDLGGILVIGGVVWIYGCWRGNWCIGRGDCGFIGKWEKMVWYIGRCVIWLVISGY